MKAYTVNFRYSFMQLNCLDIAILKDKTRNKCFTILCLLCWWFDIPVTWITPRNTIKDKHWSPEVLECSIHFKSNVPSSNIFMESSVSITALLHVSFLFFFLKSNLPVYTKRQHINHVDKWMPSTFTLSGNAVMSHDQWPCILHNEPIWPQINLYLPSQKSQDLGQFVFMNK